MTRQFVCVVLALVSFRVAADAEDAPRMLSLGSSQKEVESVLGAPRTVNGGFWFYGLSTIHFDAEGRVDGFSQVDADLGMDFRPAAQAASAQGKDTVSVGAEKDEVIRILGTPRSVDGPAWTYRRERIVFDSAGCVKQYHKSNTDIQITIPKEAGSRAEEGLVPTINNASCESQSKAAIGSVLNNSETSKK